ncbi:MAG: hypothetical protein IVW56_03215 [Candidatus Binataceae bacterium]|nr:hypothetical protein [Candidatus Binataceae bacterium]
MADDESSRRPASAKAPGAPAIDSDFASGPGLTRGDRRIIGRLSEVIRFNDFMTFMMVVATICSAFATWRTARVTDLLFSVAERPYVGVENVSIDTSDEQSARLAINFRNFGHVSASDGVARIGVVVNGRSLFDGGVAAATNNIGMISPTVRHSFFRFVPIEVYRDVRAGRSRLVVHVLISYRGPDAREFCYDQMMTYDHRAGVFISSGGSDRCSNEIY